MTNRDATWLGTFFLLLCFTFALVGVVTLPERLTAPLVECTNPPIELRLRILRLDNGDAFLLVTQNGDGRVYLLSSEGEASIEVSSD